MYIIRISIIEEGSCLGQLQLCNVPQSGFDSPPFFSQNHFQCFNCNPAQSNCCNLYSSFFRFLIFLGVWVRKCIQFCTGWPPFITFLKSQKTSLSFPFPANNSDPLRHPPHSKWRRKYLSAGCHCEHPLIKFFHKYREKYMPPCSLIKILSTPSTLGQSLALHESRVKIL